MVVSEWGRQVGPASGAGKTGKPKLLDRKLRKMLRGQTMTEYALMMAAVAILVFVTYQVMGRDIGSLVNKVNTDVTTAT